jgi:hypothetical protein
MTSREEIKARVRATEHILSADGVVTDPESVRQFLMAMTALGGIMSEETVRAEMTFNHVELAFLSEGGTAAKAKVRAKCSPEYEDYRMAKVLEEQISQLVISCRRFLTSIDEQMRLAK